MISKLIALSLFACGATSLHADQPIPYLLAGCSEQVITTQSGGSYRILLSVPDGEAPANGHAITYLLDGDELFPAMVSLLHLQGGTGKASKHNGVVPGIVVGIGYPETSRRDLDYTLPSPPGPPETYRNGKPYPPRDGGGADAFLKFIESELKPMIESNYKIDGARQTLMGNGYGGLFTLHVLFKRPELFQTYIASSPSIWWNDGYILTEEKAFAQRLTERPVEARLVLTVGELEQSLTRIESRGPEHDREEHRLKVTRRKMVDHTREMAWRLEALNSPGVEVSFKVFPDESHKSVVPLAIAHALRFAFPAP
jgi:predicted alpha/beta superfamily hydrolase